MGFQWTEVNNGNLSAPGYTLAGRGDGPATSTGDAVAAVVQAGSQALNSWSVDYAINRERERQSAFLPNYFQGHETGGMIAVAAIDVTNVGGQSANRFMHLELFLGIYRTPRDAISVWRRRDRLSSAVGTVAYRFFWITRTGA